MNYFFCYTKRVSDFLQERGFSFITVAQDPKSKKLFSLYLITEELQKALAEYKK
ncbi:hypothetical protein JGK52_03910 [Cytobacillus oceanisediminis]|uniref:hypothetical protein n=1 Tax=Cytobacillus oceanisediminis TaxID=665099 RepID=UPI001D149789|nr:hypothetical protein [Cytobacillus oceanisediminis]MCC3645830.1 hypothetical protein [Cytobacillus oceanisediminis]